MRRTPIAACLVTLAAAAGCGGGTRDDAAGTRASAAGEEPAARHVFKGRSVTAWTNEFQPDRMQKTRAIVADFSRRTGARVVLVPIPEDKLDERIRTARTAGRLPDVVLSTPVAESQAYAREGIFDADAAQQVVDGLGRATFSPRALDLVSADGKATGVPSDGWGQLLIYRRDLFAKAGLPAPRTLEDIRTAAARLDRDGIAGITLGTTPGDAFTEETFEHIALAYGCQLVDRAGKVTFDSPPCVDALRYYGDLARNYSVAAPQDVDSTRRTYFAGRAAMILWSPFLLDGMAGLRNDTRPTCPQCRRDPAFLARNSGLVGPLSRAGGQASQFGSVSTFNITVAADKTVSQALVSFLMSDGYVRWLDLSPQGKFPVRFGDKTDPQRFVLSWERLRTGVDRKARLSDFYSRRSLESLGEGVQRFQRWGFAQGQGALIGAMSGPQPISRAVAAVIRGEDPARAAAATQRRLEALEAEVG